MLEQYSVIHPTNSGRIVSKGRVSLVLYHVNAVPDIKKARLNFIIFKPRKNINPNSSRGQKTCNQAREDSKQVNHTMLAVNRSQVKSGRKHFQMPLLYLQMASGAACRSPK
jgi:hypothetical protein